MKTNEIMAALQCCRTMDCGNCPKGLVLEEAGPTCYEQLLPDAADRLEELVDRCARYAEEIAVLRQRQRWIPVTERLPENATHPGAFCPAYLVATKCGITEGWYNPDARGWFIITKYLTDDYIDFEKGDIVRVKLAKGGIVTHWMPLPEAPEVEIQ